ncbi:hypothetical protein ACXR2W_11550 [Leucobacter sp. HY1908]
MAVIGAPDLRAKLKSVVPADIWDLCRDWALLLVVFLAIASLLPTAIAQGRGHLRQRQRDLKKNTALKAAAMSFSARTANLITKVDDVINGELDKRYLAHTLSECAGYFRTRAMQVIGLEADSQMHAKLFRVVRSGNGSTKLEQIVGTHTTAGEFNVSLTSHKNPEAARIISRIADECKYYFVSKVGDVAAFERLLKLKGPKYKEYMLVPMYRDGKATGPEAVVGALMLMAEHAGSIREADAEVLQTYAWYCSAALAADKLRKKPIVTPALENDVV